MLDYRFYFLSLFVSIAFFCPNYTFCYKTLNVSTFFLENLTFNSDINFEKTEFLYLTGLHEKTVISDEDIKVAENNLYKKGRFSKIEIETEDIGPGKNLHFILTSNWILKKLILHGVWLGKHSYSSLYKQDPGDVFDVLLHEKNIKEIKEFLQDKGYFNYYVSDELIYNKKDKSIIVKVSIKKRSRFSVKTVDFNLISDDVIDGEAVSLQDKDSFIRSLKHKIGTRLIKKNYSKKGLKKN